LFVTYIYTLFLIDYTVTSMVKKPLKTSFTVVAPNAKANEILFPFVIYIYVIIVCSMEHRYCRIRKTTQYLVYNLAEFVSEPFMRLRHRFQMHNKHHGRGWC
jgi:hypothetical protein